MQHKAKKSLGQNFLKSVLALNKIIEAGEVKADDVVLEIGPGKGVLTNKLLQAGARVIAVEKDRELFEFLKIKFEKEIKSCSLILAHDDILKFDIKKEIYKYWIGRNEKDFFSGPRFSGSQSRPDHEEKSFSFLPYKIIANIPYNITGAILKKFLTEEYQPERMILMLQNEVAKRIVAQDKKESILSISVKAYGTPKIIMKVPARYFSPMPKVDSAIISIKNISRKNFLSSQNQEKFWKIVKAGFAHKRKKLSSNLKTLCPKDTLVELGNKRAENLTLENWITLAN